MDEGSTTVGRALVTTGRRLGVFQEAMEAGRRARVTRPSDSPAFLRALERLDRALSSDQPLSRDVPRGYYLNIKA